MFEEEDNESRSHLMPRLAALLTVIGVASVFLGLQPVKLVDRAKDEAKNRISIAIENLVRYKQDLENKNREAYERRLKEAEEKAKQKEEKPRSLNDEIERENHWIKSFEEAKIKYGLSKESEQELKDSKWRLKILQEKLDREQPKQKTF